MTTETKGNASFVGEMYNDPFCFLMFNQIAKFVHEARQNEMKLRQIERGEEPNDPSSPTAKPEAGNQDGQMSRSVQRLVRPLEGDLDKPDRHVDTTNVTFQVNDQMPMSSVRRGYMEWANQSETTGKIVRVPTVVFGELVILNKSDVSLLIERNFDDVFGTEVGPLVVEVFHGNDGERPNDPSSPTPAQAGASQPPDPEKGVRCSAWLGDRKLVNTNNPSDI